MQRTVRVTAPAKINLFLSIGDVRPDGYHDVVTVTQTISLTDTITLESADTLELACDTDLGIPATENLAYRAAVRLGEVVGRDPAVRITIEKSIPAGAGFAGGSSNAAAVVAGLAHLWGIDACDDAVLEAAAGVGADVPLFLMGGTNLMGERGDRLVERLPTPTCSLLVLWPETPVSTAEAYRAVDANPQRPLTSPDAMIAACRAGTCEAVAGAFHNNMTDASIGLVPRIADALAWTEEADDVRGAVMAGSGSAVCAVCASSESASALAAKARAEGWWARDAQTLPVGVTVEEKERP